jgi:GLPGLI family protein
MKKIVMTAFALLTLFIVRAQQKEGKVIYQRVLQMQVSFSGMSEEMQRLVPKNKTDKFELNFANNQSIWRPAEQDDDETGLGGDGGGMQLRFTIPGSNDVLYDNFETMKKVEQRELFDKKFIIDDSIKPLKWKMTGETKTILNHNCMKATTTEISQKSQMKMTDGKMQRTETTDTSVIVAWFASDIPVPAGPAEFQGELPGLILEIDISNGRLVFRALEINPKADLASIKEPAGKKRYTAEEFKAEREKMMKEMQKNGGGPVMKFNRQ